MRMARNSFHVRSLVFGVEELEFPDGWAVGRSEQVQADALAAYRREGEFAVFTDGFAVVEGLPPFLPPDLQLEFLYPIVWFADPGAGERLRPAEVHFEPARVVPQSQPQRVPGSPSTAMPGLYWRCSGTSSKRWLSFRRSAKAVRRAGAAGWEVFGGRVEFELDDRVDRVALAGGTLISMTGVGLVDGRFATGQDGMT